MPRNARPAFASTVAALVAVAGVTAVTTVLGCSDEPESTPSDAAAAGPSDAANSHVDPKDAAALPYDSSAFDLHDATTSNDGDSGSSHPQDAGSPTPICPSTNNYPSPLPNNPTATLVQGGFGFLEGPVWVDALGVLLFSDMDFSTNGSAVGPSSKIRRLTPPSTFDVLVPSSGSNGLALDLDGKILAATHDVQSLSRFDPATGTREMWPLLYMTKHWNSPNDVAVHDEGIVYVTDPDWQLGSRSSETGMRGVYRVDPDGDRVTLIDGSLSNPNGITLSPDQTKLYVSSQASEVKVFDVASDGSVSNGRKFVSTAGGGDGMAVDCAGNLYVTTGDVEVFDPSGTKLGTIAVAETAANAAFGGSDRKTLYITARTGLYAITLNVPGLPY